ncbi:MAG: hypothetical protein AB7I50_12770 [Vicinamibacterales bacterium]
MYVAFVFLHSWLRWVVLIAGLWAVIRGFMGTAGRRPWTAADDTAGRLFSITMDVQLLVGLLLYGLFSPITTQALMNMAEAMRNSTLRFWAVEHLTLMFVAVVLVHVGRARSRKAPTDGARHQSAALFYALALLAVLLAIPWPFMSVGRPLFRF